MIALQQPKEQPFINNKAMAWTIGVHLLILLFFVVFRYTVTQPPPVVDQGGGMEVNLGTSDEGSGHNQPMSVKAPAPYRATVVFKSVAAHSSVPKDILQSTDEDAPAVSNNSKKKGVAATNETGHKQEKPKYTYAGGNGAGGNSALQNMPGTNEGNGTGPGDKGVPGGTPGAANYAGIPGNGTGGIGHTLSGRTIYPDKFEAEFNEGGKVVIHVTVDRNGEIVSKIVKSSSSPQLTKIALEKLRDAHFSKSNSSEPQQFGDITIFFTTRK